VLLDINRAMAIHDSPPFPTVLTFNSFLVVSDDKNPLTFTCFLSLIGQDATGTGSKKKAAQQQAATFLIDKLLNYYYDD